MNFKGIVSEEFIWHRDKNITNDRRPPDVAARQWDFEIVEYHQSSISSTGHRIYEGYEYDTDHDFFGHCDFKHVNRHEEFHLSPYIIRQLKEGNIDHIVLWKFNPHPHLWKSPLAKGDSFKYQILEYIDRNEILRALNNDMITHGYRIRQ